MSLWPIEVARLALTPKSEIFDFYFMVRRLDGLMSLYLDMLVLVGTQGLTKTYEHKRGTKD